MEQQHIHLVHHVPGRSRFRIPKTRHSRKASKLIQERGKAVPGVHDIRVNPVTGSAVVHYDPHQPEVRERLAHVIKEADKLLSIAMPEVGEFEEAAEILGPDVETLFRHVPLLGKIVSSIKASDQKLKQATGGAVDINTLLPLVIAAGLLFFDTKNKPLILGFLGLISLHAYITLQGSKQP